MIISKAHSNIEQPATFTTTTMDILQLKVLTSILTEAIGTLYCE
jgi:hypothetical protein